MLRMIFLFLLSLTIQVTAVAMDSKDKKEASKQESPAPKPAIEKASKQESPALEPATEKASKQESPAPKPVTEKTSKQESPALEPATEKASKKESPAPKPATEKASKQESPAPKPATEKASKQESPALEPATEKASKSSASKPATEKASKSSASKPATEKASKSSASKPATEKASKSSASKPATEKASKSSASKPAVEQASKSSASKPATEKASKSSVPKPVIEKANSKKEAEKLVSEEIAENKQEEKEASQREISSKNIRNVRIKRDQSFQVPESSDSKHAEKPKKRLNLQSIQPSSARVYYQEGSDEAQLERVMIEEEQQLFKLLKKSRNADLTLRLGALYVDRSRIISYKIQNDYDFKMQQFNQGLRSSKPFLNLKPAQNYNRKSLKLFEDFVEHYPNHKRMDEVLFFLGFNFYQLENKKRGIEYYNKLEKRFPKSFYLYEARFQMGEHYFQLRDWKQSYRYYSMVSKNKSGKFYFYSLYKMAWSLYKMDRASQGLVLLKRIIEEGRSFAATSDRSQMLNFREEATQDLVLFYTYSGKDASEARSFFIDLLGDKIAWPRLEKLAYTYRETGQTNFQVILFQNLISNNPTGKKAFEYKYQIVEAVYSTGRIPLILETISQWVRDYGPRSNWVTANQRDPSHIEKSLKLQEVTIRDYALKNHQTYRKSRSNKAKQLALSLYEYYFSAFPKSEYSDQMYFWYAELLFDSKKYIPAIKAYEEVISSFPKSKYIPAAYLNQVLAFEKSFPSEKKIKQVVGKSKEAVELPQIIKSFASVANRYVKKFPQAENSPSILYTMATMYYRFNQFDEATVFFRQISTQYPKHSLSSSVNAILLDTYNKNKNYVALEQLAFELSKNPNLDRKLLKEVKGILEQISLKKAEELASEGKYKESAIMYESFAKKYPNSSDAVTAFFNAGLNFEKIGDHLRAVAMYSSVLTYKSSSLEIRKKSHRFLAILHEKLGFYKKAADSYVSFAKKYPTDSRSSDFWYNAGVIFDALNQVSSAVYSYNQYYKTSRKSDRHDVFFLIALMYEDNKNWTRAVQNYDQFLKTPSSNATAVMRASFSIAKIYETKLRKASLAKEWYEKTLKLYRRLNTGLNYGARSHFYLVKKDYYEPFSKIKLPKNSKGQEQALAKKIKLLQKMEKALKPIIRYNDGEVILSSLALVGRSNEELARTIESAPIPKGLDKKGRDQYKIGIRKVITPYVKKSIEHYQLVIKRSVKLGVYSEVISEAYSRLAGIQLSRSQFVRFLPQSLIQHRHSVTFEDDTGTVNPSFFSSLQKSLKYNLSRNDFENLSQAIQNKREQDILSAVSVILNKDLKNVVAINSLAFFYLKTNRLGLAQLILNRLISNNQKNPVILNNLALIALKYRRPRQALAFLKQAIELNSNYMLAHLNLADIFINQGDYQNAYRHYKRALTLIERKTSKSRMLKDNYSVALTGSQKWKQGQGFFQRIVRGASPKAETLFNYSCFLAERSKREPRNVAVKTLAQAKDFAEELKVQRLNAKLQRKVMTLSQNLSFQIKTRSKK